MKWNYRVVERKISDTESEFGIHEAYFNDAGEFQGITIRPLSPVSDSMEGLKHELEIKMMRAFEEQVIQDQE